MGGSFTKSPLEQYPIAVEYGIALPEASFLANGVLSAIDLMDGTDATTDILDTTVGEITGTLMAAFVKGGVHGHAYCIRFVASIVPGDPVPVLVDEVIMVVHDGCLVA